MLIVEDDFNFREAMHIYFNGLGYRLRSADRAEEAMRLAVKFQPDILIADWMLAGEIDGVALARHLHRCDSALSIILITARSRRDISRASADLPVTAIV